MMKILGMEVIESDDLQTNEVILARSLPGMQTMMRVGDQIVRRTQERWEIIGRIQNLSSE